MVVRGVVFGHCHQSSGRSEFVGDLFNVFSLMLLVVLNYVILYALIGLVVIC